MSVSEISRLMGKHENRLWRLVDFYTEQEIEKQDFSLEPLVNLAIGKISRKKWHVYLTKPKAKIIFGKFLVMKALNEQLEVVKRRE